MNTLTYLKYIDTDLDNKIEFNSLPEKLKDIFMYEVSADLALYPIIAVMYCNNIHIMKTCNGMPKEVVFRRALLKYCKEID